MSDGCISVQFPVSFFLFLGMQATKAAVPSGSARHDGSVLR